MHLARHMLAQAMMCTECSPHRRPAASQAKETQGTKDNQGTKQGQPDAKGGGPRGDPGQAAGREVLVCLAVVVGKMPPPCRDRALDLLLEPFP